jgi:hypothetical protein
MEFENISLQQLFTPVQKTPSTSRHDTLSECRFSESNIRSHRPRLSEKRYSTDPDQALLSEDSFTAHSKKGSEVFSISNLLEDTQEFQGLKIPTKLLNYNEEMPKEAEEAPKHHRRVSSHQRKQSIFFMPNTPYNDILDQLKQRAQANLSKAQTAQSRKKVSKTVSFCSEVEDISEKVRSREATPRSRCSTHVRTASDADSVIYVGPGEFSPDKLPNLPEISLSDSLESKNNTVIICGDDLASPLKDKLPTTCTTQPHQEDFRESFFFGKAEFKYETAITNSLPKLGTLPCTAYCSNCREDVHTKIDFKQDPGTLVKLLSDVFACCNVPVWLGKMRVHKCVVCSMVIAKSI